MPFNDTRNHRKLTDIIEESKKEQLEAKEKTVKNEEKRKKDASIRKIRQDNLDKVVRLKYQTASEVEFYTLYLKSLKTFMNKEGRSLVLSKYFALGQEILLITKHLKSLK